MTPPIDRRSFLALGIGALAWACARPEEEGASPTPTGGGSQALSVIAGGGIMALGDSRLPVVLLRGQRPVAPRDIEIRLVSPGGERVEVEPSRQRITRGLGGHEDHDHTHAPGTVVEDIFVVRHDFDAPGAWQAEVVAGDERAAGAFQIVEEMPSPMVGQQAIAVPSPTTADGRGVDPICTRDPVCSLHAVTIEEALARNRPVVITFATPRFCTSRACGPVVDLVEENAERVGDSASFLHIEVWKDDGEAVGKEPAPAFQEWEFQGEPWTYFIDADGVVQDRWLGPVGRDELVEAVDALIG